MPAKLLQRNIEPIFWKTRKPPPAGIQTQGSEFQNRL